jgi:hypothetical protein
MERDEYLRLGDAELLRQCEVDTYRASGPGGQKRNKTSSAVRLRHKDTGVKAHADGSRSQHVNKAEALRRLRAHLAIDLRQEIVAEGFEPGGELAGLLAGGLVKRRSDKTKQKLDYLLAVAALLDLFVAHDCALADTARSLGVSTGALSRFFLADERIARRVNELRSARGMRLLR